MAKWDRMDRLAWDKSEVAKEFENIILDACDRLEHLASMQKEASGLSDLANESAKAQESIKGTTDSVTNLDSALKSINTAEDDVSDSKDVNNAKDDEHHIAKRELIEHLKAQAALESDSGDFRLVYKIERAIDELEEI